MKIRYWTTKEDVLLRKLASEGFLPPEMAKALNRTLFSVQQRPWSGARNGYAPNFLWGKYQQEGEEFTFECGCSGVLSKKPNKLAVYFSDKFRRERGISQKTKRPFSSDRWICRISTIILSSRNHAKMFGSVAIVCNDHRIIRDMMKNPNCVECNELLKWDFERGQTPHLDHDHETGRPIGFAHPGCNRNKLERGELSMVQELIELGYLVVRKEDVSGLSLY